MLRSSQELDLFLQFMQQEPVRQASSQSGWMGSIEPSALPAPAQFPPDVILRDLWSLIDGSATSSERPDRSRP